MTECQTLPVEHLDQSRQAASRLFSAKGRIAILLPHVEGGVTDYAAMIAKRLGAIHTRFAEGRLAGWPGQAGQPETIVVQFSGYGFHSRGIPFELLRWVRQRKASGVRIGVFFHELFASGPPWRSSFWLSPVQRHIAAELARAADFWMTNREGSAEWLLRCAGEKPNAVLPTPSNVGETEAFAGQRDRALVIFGSPAVRLETYRQGGPSLLEWAARESLAVYDLGAPLQDREWRSRLKQLGVRAQGRLSPHEVSLMLAQAAFGAIAYPLAYIAKSSVFAAYCAHGVCPIVYSSRYPETDGLVAGRNYLTPRQLEGASTQGESCARQAHTWYQAHSLDRHAQALQSLLAG